MVEKRGQENATVASNYETVNAYYKTYCMEFKIRTQKAEGKAIKDYAAAHGVSAQALFLAAVADYMAQGKAPSAVKRGRKPKDKSE